MPAPTIEDAAVRLAALLTYAGGALADPERHNLVFEDDISLHPLARTTAPCDVWAVDGGQAVVADARSVQVAVTRAARVRWRDGACALEEEGELRAHLLGCGEERLALAVDGPARAAGRGRSISTCSATGASGRRRPAAWRRRTPAAWCWSTATCSPTGGCRHRWLGQLLAGGFRPGRRSGRSDQALVAGPGWCAPARPPRAGGASGCSGRGACGGPRWRRPGPTAAPTCRSWPPGSTPTPASPSGSTCPPAPTLRPPSAPCPPCPTTPPSPATRTR